MLSKKLTTLLLSTAMVLGTCGFAQGSAYAAGNNGKQHNKWINAINGEQAQGWFKNNTKWYYFSNSGSLEHGWMLHNGKWYFFNNGGDMQTGWLLHNGKWYFMGEDGDMQKGWMKNNNKWYYLNDDGEMEHSCWIYYNSKWYYLGQDGKMEVSTTTPDGYDVGDDGSWTGVSDNVDIPDNVEAEAVSSNKIDLTWDDVDNADYYLVYYSLDPDEDFKAVLDEDGNKEKFENNSATIENIAQDTKVYFKVAAVDGSVRSKFSDVVNAVTDKSTKIVAPENLSAKAVSSSKINVTWDEVIGADSYKIYYRESSENNWDDVEKTTNSASFTGLDPETEMEFKVKAIQGDIESGYSDVVSETTSSED